MYPSFRVFIPKQVIYQFTFTLRLKDSTPIIFHNEHFAIENSEKYVRTHLNTILAQCTRIKTDKIYPKLNQCHFGRLFLLNIISFNNKICFTNIQFIR